MTNTITETTVAALDAELNEMILAGKIFPAFEKFYAEDCVMQENTSEPRVGKEANREYEEQFHASVEEFHGVRLLASAADDEVTLSEWEWDITFKEGGRTKLNQVAVRRWAGDKISHERFYYNAA